MEPVITEHLPCGTMVDILLMSSHVNLTAAVGGRLHCLHDTSEETKLMKTVELRLNHKISGWPSSYAFSKHVTQPPECAANITCC